MASQSALMFFAPTDKKRNLHWVAVVPFSAELRAVLVERGSNALLVKRCVLKRVGEALQVFVTINREHKGVYMYQVNEIFLPAGWSWAWQPVYFDEKRWLELTKSCSPQDFA